MTQLIWQALRAPSPRRTILSGRYITSRQRPLPTCLHTTNRKLAEDEPKPPPQGSWQPLFLDTNALGGILPSQEKTTGPSDDGPSKPSRPVDVSHYGSALRRAGRNVKKVKELPQVGIPSWLLERNVDLVEDRFPDPVIDGHLADRAQAKSETLDRPIKQRDGGSEQEKSVASEKLSADAYLFKQMKIHHSTTEEISSLVQAGLRIPSAESSHTTAHIKNHISIASPKKGCSAFLSAFVQDLARANQADFLRLNSQDIAEVGGEYLETASDFRADSLSALGYDTAQAASAASQSQQEELLDQDEAEVSEEEDGHERPGIPSNLASQMSKIMGIPVKVGVVSNMKLDNFFRPNNLLSTLRGGRDSNQPSNGNAPGHTFTIKDDTPDMMMTLLIETILNTPELKRMHSNPSHSTSSETKPHSQEDQSAVELQRGSNKLVVLIEDYQWIYMTRQGAGFLDKLHEIVEARRNEGQAVLVVGVSSSENMLISGDAKFAIDDAQARSWDRWMRNVIVPVRTTSDDGLLWNEHKKKIRDINLRHLRDMLRKTAPNISMVSDLVDDWDLSIDSKFAFLGGLDRSVWPMFKVNRVATVAQGLISDSEPMTANTLGEAIAIIDASDSSKYRWHKRDADKSKNNKETTSSPSPSQNPAQQSDQQAEDRLKKLRKKCNTHEKKLLNGVVDPKSIRTTFADVHVPDSTIQAIKTLTSLSLIRPDAFTYGVLAHDRIPGILLYGPPGTGKTLLAKAVAKESGATVLEVSGSDVYDMYVGEGEKNVRAIFTLARKLSPCVVFIDEADAILGSRSSGHSRTSHRELVNQFLREWDGMTTSAETNAFIMIATNRPYDLDEASLRRVPRRLLVDLPTEKDREAILRIHLKDEKLDAGVDVAGLASQTPFYSGSDLKNLCVAAALGCVREEYEDSIKQQQQQQKRVAEHEENAESAGSSSSSLDHRMDEVGNEKKEKEADVVPAKRILLPRHFEAALQEISASISEDMGSLGAIRKFDEKYGDRRGRRKGLKGGYGFGVKVDGEEGKGEGRVRKEI